jgi:hypothetical protein
MAYDAGFPTQASIVERSDLGTGPQAVWKFWDVQLDLAQKEDYDFIQRGMGIVERYRDERDANERRVAKYNILWSNVEVLKPVLYGRMPQPDVARPHEDTADPAAWLGATILERSLQWEDDIEELDDVLSRWSRTVCCPGTGWRASFTNTTWARPSPTPTPRPTRKPARPRPFSRSPPSGRRSVMCSGRTITKHPRASKKRSGGRPTAAI